MVLSKEKVPSPSKRLWSQLLLSSHRQFTGRIDLQGLSGQKWSLYLNLGRLVWTTGGNHPVRRWRRLMFQYCPNVNWQQINWRQHDHFECWDYELLNVLAEQKLLSLARIVDLIKANAVEVLFDIVEVLESKNSSKSSFQQPVKWRHLLSLDLPENQSENLQIHFEPGARPSHNVILPPFCLLKLKPIMKQACSEWENWVKTGLGSFSPNLAPVLKQNLSLPPQNSDRTYQNLLKLVNGKRTLRDVALRTKSRNLLNLTLFLASYINQEMIKLVPVSDINLSIPGKYTLTDRRSLIVCIDNSLQVCSQMREIVESSGSRFLAINNEVQALPLLLEHKPDLIFLDLIMPIVNGYEICAQIRRTSYLKQVPVVMLSTHENIVDRVRAKISGATDFLSKPIETNRVKLLLNHYQFIKDANIGTSGHLAESISFPIQGIAKAVTSA